jgi:hypothetical protein
MQFTGCKESSLPLVSPHLPHFIVIDICHVINDEYVSEIMTMNVLK